MDYGSLIPDPGSIQVQWGWFQGLLFLTFVLHLLLMNTVLGTAIIAAVRSLSGRGDSDVNKDLSIKLPTCVALAVNFGVAPLLFLQVLYGHLFYVSDIIMGWYWLSVFLLIIFAYYGAYLYDFKFDALGSARTVVITLAALLLLWISFMFTNNLTILTNPERWFLYFENQDGAVLNWGDPILFPRWLHFVTASIAVAGLALAVNWTRKAKKGVANAAENASMAMRWFAWGTAAQFVVGSWFLLSLPRPIMLLFMSGPMLHRAVFAAAMVGAVLLVVLGFKGRVWGALIMLVPTMVCMVVVRELVRVAYLAPYFDVTGHVVQGEYSPMVLFVISLVVGLGVMAYILKLAAEATREA